MVAALVVVAVSDRWAALVVREPYRQRLADSHQLAVPCHVPGHFTYRCGETADALPVPVTFCAQRLP